MIPGNNKQRKCLIDPSLMSVFNVSMYNVEFVASNVKVCCWV